MDGNLRLIKMMSMKHSAESNYINLTTAPVPRLIMSLAVPTITSMLVTSFYVMNGPKYLPNDPVP